MACKVWFELVDGEGQLVMSADFVDCPINSTVARFRKAVFAKAFRILSVKVIASSLTVFANWADYTSGKTIAKLSSPLTVLGKVEDNPVIVQVPSKRRLEMHPEPASKKPKTSTVIQDEQMESIRQSLEIDTWQVGGIALDICQIEPDFPEWFYVRKETIDIINFFEAQMKENKRIVFEGTPGVGKSILVVLFAFHLALIQKKIVFLFRKQYGKAYSLLYLDAVKKNYWRMDDAEIDDLKLHLQCFNNVEVCLDGFQYSHIKSHHGYLARNRLLATSAPYPMKGAETDVRSQCLVPFWSLSDLNAIGANCEWPENENNDRYFYSGGNLRAFLLGQDQAETMIDDAIRQVVPHNAELFYTEYMEASVSQVDRLRMMGIKANDHRDLDKYKYQTYWTFAITSEYALRQLGNIVKPNYYKELWFNKCKLGDDRLMGIAFKNYVHTLAREGKKIKLQIREYDRVKVIQHTYVALEIEVKSCRNDDVDASDCDAAMKRFASSSDDYWYPSGRSLETIDSVAKLKMDGQPSSIGFLQITTSIENGIDSVAVEKYARLFPNGSRYIALVPNKETCDNFRFVPADPATQVSLDVAYISTLSF